MAPSDSDTYHVTMKEETMEELEELFPATLDRTEAIRMAVDEAIHRRKSELKSSSD